MMATTPASTDRKIVDVTATLERTRANLVELDADVTRKTLDSSSTLEGRTAEAWAAASRQFAVLWQDQLALDTVLEEIGTVRGARTSIPKASLERLGQLLDGPSVVVARSGPAGRALTDDTSPTERLSIDEVIARMSVDYGAVTTVLEAVGAVWGDTLSVLGSLRTTITELEAEAEASRVRRPNQLGQARRSLDELEQLARRDPLSFPPDAVASVQATVDHAGRMVREAAEAEREVAGELRGVQATLDNLKETLVRLRADHASPTRKVEVSARARVDWEQAEGDLIDLQGQFEAAKRLSASHPVDARRTVSSLAGAITAVQHSIDSLASIETAGVVARDELRGRLQALRAKAQAMGRGEDRQLDRIYGEAQDALFSAPCDLQRADDLVSQFHEALRAAQAGAT